MKEKNLFLKRAILALCLMAVCWVPARAQVLLGDVNGDGKRNISDVTALISAVLKEDFSNLIVANADMNGDDVVNISDVTMMISCLMNETWPDDPSQDEGYWVDLGLPSGTLWATRNIGASFPEDYGAYFAWGETAPKEKYEWDTYMWCINNTYENLIKYCTLSSYGTVDNRTELEPEDDAAYVNWGSAWRMPTMGQYDELLNSCSWQWTTRSGVNGQLVTGPNGKSIFLPAAGYRYAMNLNDCSGMSGYYWSRSLNTEQNLYAHARDFSIGVSLYWFNGRRRHGFTVRAVRVPLN